MSLLLAACAARSRVIPIGNTFLEDVDTTKSLENLPFDHAWVHRSVLKASYDSIYIKPVRLDLLPRDAWRMSTSSIIDSEEAYLEKAKEIATYFEEQLREKFANSDSQWLRVVGTPNQRSLTLEIAFTELEFSHPLVRAAALAAPVPGTGPAVSAISDPHAAFALRLTDSSSRTLVASAASRKFAPLRLVDFNKLTVSSSVREISALWAASIVESIQSGGMNKVSEKRFSLIPW